MTSNEVQLSISGLDVWRGSVQVVRDFSLNIDSGESVALLGRNGAGKTSTLMGIMGMATTKGEIRFDSNSITDIDTHERVRKGIAYVPENREIFSNLSVAENIRLATLWNGKSGRLKSVLEIFPELEERWDQRGGTLSGGQQQMLALARAWATDSSMMLIDEPTKGLAPVVVDRVVDAMKRLQQTYRVTSIIVEQNLEVALALAQRAVVLTDGHLSWMGDIGQLKKDRNLAQRLLGVSDFQ